MYYLLVLCLVISMVKLKVDSKSIFVSNNKNSDNDSDNNDNDYHDNNKMIRESEDYIDELDCESFTREKLVRFREIKNLDKNKELRIGRVPDEESDE